MNVMVCVCHVVGVVIMHGYLFLFFVIGPLSTV